MRSSRSSAAVLAAALVAVALAGPALAQTGEPVNILPEVEIIDNTVVVPSTSSFEVEEATAIGAESFGPLGDGDGGLGAGMWQGSDRAAIEALLPFLAAGPGSPTLRDLARRLLLTSAVAPVGPANRNLLGLRLDRLAALGLGAEGMGAGVSDPAVIGALARLRFNEALARSDTAAACAEPEPALRLHPDLEWQRALILCQLLAGNREAAGLGLAVLVETGAPLGEDFVGLADAAAAGSPPPSVGLAGATLIDLALARLVGAEIPFDATETRDPLVLRLLAGPDAESEDVRLGAAERAAVEGIVPPEALANAYGAVAFDATAMAEAGQSDVYIPRERALLYQAARQEGNPEHKAELIARAVGAAREGGGAHLGAATARIYAPLIGGFLPTADMAWFAPHALRLALTADDPGTALAWWRLASERANADPMAPEVALMWPLARLAGIAGPAEGDGARVAAWWEAAEASREAEARTAQADTFAALLAALGEPGGALLVARVLAAPAAPANPPPRSGVLAALAEASAAGRVGETVLLALIALADEGPAAPAMALAGAVQALRRVGLEVEARRLALEGAIAHGL